MAEKRKQGSTVYLTLTGWARDWVSGLTLEDISKENGITNIMKNLDTLFLKDQNTHTCLAFKEFYNFQHPPGMNITEFLVKF